MSGAYPHVRAAAVQASPIFLDRAASTGKACSLIREAGAEGADIVAFPEGFIPTHPVWFHFFGATDPRSVDFSTRLFHHAVEVPGPETDALATAAREAGCHAVVGVCEKLPGSLGTMYNTQIYLSPDDGYVGKHQKLVPTAGERLVHHAGSSETFGTFPTRFGPASAMMCTENANPLAIFALTAQHTRFHVMSWPYNFPTRSRTMPELSLLTARAFAHMSKAHVISACGVVGDDMRSALDLAPEEDGFLRQASTQGGSAIVAPDTSVLAGPLDGDTEGIIHADLDVSTSIRLKLRHDFSGHYNRPDVFRLLLRRSAAPLLVEEGPDLATVPGVTALGESSMVEVLDFAGTDGAEGTEP